MANLICTLCGNGVFHGYSNIGAINSIEEISKVFDYCKRNFNIEFDKSNHSKCIDVYVYHLVEEDKRDITLIIEKVYEL